MAVFATSVGAAEIDPAGILAERVSPAGPGEQSPPTGHGVMLRAAAVPEVAGTALVFADVVADVDLTPARADKYALRVALQGGRASVAAEGRTVGTVGNLRVSWWSVSGWGDDDDPDDIERGLYRHAWSVGASGPLGDALGIGSSFYEQRSEVSVPGYAVWGRYVWLWSAGDMAWMIDAMLGLAVSGQTRGGLVAQLTPTFEYGFLRDLAGSIAVVIPGQFVTPNPTLLVGLRWRPLERLELAAGTHVALRALDGEVDLHPLRPVVEVRGRF